MAGNGNGNEPKMPEGLLDRLVEELEDRDAPFSKYLERDMKLVWLPAEDNRLGFTRFECDHNEIYRRRRLGIPRDR